MDTAALKHGSSEQTFREVLVDVGKILSADDVELIAFECGIFSRGERGKIRDGVELMQAMHDKEFVTQENISDLFEILSRRNLNQACFFLRNYERELTCEHSTSTLVNYCDTCCKRMCADCTLSHQSQCDVIVIEEMSQKIKDESEKLLAQLDAAKDHILTAKELIHQQEDLKEDYVEHAKGEIRRQFRRVHSNVDNKRHELIAICLQVKNINERDYSQHLSTIDRYCNEMGLIEENGVLESNTSLIGAVSNARYDKNIQRMMELSKGLTNEIAAVKKQNVGIVCRRVHNDSTYCTLKLTNKVGSVVLGSNQLVHMYDRRVQDRSVRLICIDPKLSGKEFWRYDVKLDSFYDPVVMSHIPIYYSALYHLVFAVGKTVFVVHPHWWDTYFDYVLSVSNFDITDIAEDSWICSITTNWEADENNRRYIYICKQNSSAVTKYSVSGERLKVIDVGDLLVTTGIARFTSSESPVNAIICRGLNNVVLFTEGPPMKRCGSLRQVVASMFPVTVVWTGGGWLVFNISGGKTEKVWNVVYYDTDGDLLKVCAEGKYNDIDFPVNTTQCQYDGYVSFSRNCLQAYDLKCVCKNTLTVV